MTFPFYDHLTLAEVATIERWRRRWPDDELMLGADPKVTGIRAAIFVSKIPKYKIIRFIDDHPRYEPQPIA